MSNNNKVNPDSMIYGAKPKAVGIPYDNGRHLATKFAQNALKQTNLENVKRK